MSEVPSGEFGVPTKETEGKPILLRDIYSNTINVQIPPEKEESVWDIGKRKPGTSPLRSSRSAVEDNVSLGITSRLEDKAVVQIPVTPSNVKYYEVGEPLAKKDKLSFPNSIWLQELHISEDDFDSLRDAGRKTYTLGDLALAPNIKNQLSDVIEKQRHHREERIQKEQEKLKIAA